MRLTIASLLGERWLDLWDRLAGGLEANGRHAEGAGGLAVDVQVVEEDAAFRRGPAQPLERELEDRRVGHAGPRRRSTTTSKSSSISGSLERQSGSHSRTLFVRGGAHAAAAQLAHELDHPRVRLQALEVERAEAGEVEAVLEVRLDPRP